MKKDRIILYIVIVVLGLMIVTFIINLVERNNTPTTVPISAGALNVQIEDILNSPVSYPNGWHINTGDVDLGDSVKVEPGLYTFDHSNCKNAQWSGSDVCKYFNQSYIIPLVNTQGSSIVLTYHTSTTPTNMNAFLESYKKIVKDNEAQNQTCIGGVLVSKDKLSLLSVVSNTKSEDSYAIFDMLKSQTSFDTFYRCDQKSNF